MAFSNARHCRGCCVDSDRWTGSASHGSSAGGVSESVTDRDSRACCVRLANGIAPLFSWFGGGTISRALVRKTPRATSSATAWSLFQSIRRALRREGLHRSRGMRPERHCRIGWRRPGRERHDDAPGAQAVEKARRGDQAALGCSRGRADAAIRIAFKRS